MADEKTIVKAGEAQAEKAKAKESSKFVKFFKNLPKAIVRPFKNMWHELRKVTWPTRQDLINYTLIVLAFLVFMGVVIGLLDMVSVSLTRAI